MPTPTARDRFFTALKKAFYEGTFAEMVLEKYQGLDRRMRAISVRQTSLLPGKQIIAFISIHEAHQTEKSFSILEALDELQKLIGTTFLEAHLVTTTETHQLSFTLRGGSNLKVTANSEMPSRPDTAPTPEEPAETPAASTASPWHRPLEAALKKVALSNAASFSKIFINEFTSWLTPLLEYGVRPSKKKPTASREQPFTIVQLNSGHGQLAFALATTLGPRARVHAIDAHPALIELCNRIAGSERLINLAFTSPPPPGSPAPECDVLIALNTSDTDTDNALALGLAAEASLIVIGPSRHRESRAQLPPPPVWPEAIRQEPLLARLEAPILDAFRALLLACAGYKIKTLAPTQGSPELLLAAVKPRIRAQDVSPEAVRDFARFYGIRTHRLAQRLGITL